MHMGPFSVNPPACQLESVFRPFENWADVIDTHDRRAKFFENCVGAFGDKSRQSRLATTEVWSALLRHAWDENKARDSPRRTPQDDAPQSTFLDEGGEERITASQMHLANKLVQCVWSQSLG